MGRVLFEKDFEDGAETFSVRGRCYAVEIVDGVPTVYDLGTPRRLTEDGKEYFDSPPTVVSDSTPEIEEQVRRILRE